MLTWIKKLFSPPVFEDDEDKTRTAAQLNIILWTMVWAITVAAPFMIFDIQDPLEMYTTTILVFIFLAVIGGLIWMSHRGHVRRASILLSAFILLVATVVILIFGGIRATTTPAYLLAIFIAGLLLGWRAAAISCLLSILFTLGTLLAENYRITIFGEMIPVMPIETDPLLSIAKAANIGDWFMLVALFVITTVVVGLAWRNLTTALARARGGEQELSEANRELRASRDQLQARTRILERRSRQLEATAEVFRDTTTIHDLDELLSLAANLIQTRFGFHFAAIFLSDEEEQYAALRAATGESGRRLLEQELHLSLEETNIVSQAIHNRYHRIVLRSSSASAPQALVAAPSAEPIDQADQVEQAAPPILTSPLLLPESHSELVLPLRVGRRAIGALDIQSREEAAFDENDAAALQILADQLAVAIENCRLLGEMERTVQELEIASGRYTQETWSAAMQKSGTRGYRYRRTGIERVAEQPPEARQAWQEGEAVVTSPGDGRGQAGTLAVPIKLREQTVGVLDLRFESSDVPAETISLIEEVTNRLALAMENARLLDETRRRAERDRLTADITARVRASTNIDTILRTAIQELSQALRASDGLIRLGVETPQEDESPETETIP